MTVTENSSTVTVEQLRQEYAGYHQKAEALVKAADGEKRDLTTEEETQFNDFCTKMESVNKKQERYNKLAGSAFAGGKAQTTTPMPGQENFAAIEGETEAERVERFFEGPQKSDRIKQYRKALNKWAATGEFNREAFATITTATDSGVLLPTAVGTPLTPTAAMTFRQAHDVLGVATLKTGTTATLNLPVLDALAGGVVSQTQSSDTENPPGVTDSMVIPVTMYESGSAWFSRLQLEANDFDLLAASEPSMRYAKELALESYMTAAIIADSSITQSVTTATTAGFKYPDLVSLNRALPKRYDALKAIVLSTSAYIAAEAMVDANGRPIMVVDAQNQWLKMFNGTPVLRSDYFQALGTAANVVGVVFSLLGFRLRDAGPEVIERYINIPTRKGQIGFSIMQGHGWGYAKAAIAKLVNHA